MLELLFTTGLDLSVEDNDGISAVRYAARGGHGSVLELLSTKGVDLSSEDNFGGTAAHYAARGGHGSVLELLFTKDLDLSAEDNDGSTAVHYAVRVDMVWCWSCCSRKVELKRKLSKRPLRRCMEGRR